jgi:hypothetical protein
MVDHEALETSAVVGQLADAVEHEVNNLVADGVVATSKVVGSVHLARNELLAVEQLAVVADADFVDNGRLEIDEHGTGNVIAGTSLREEGAEGVVDTPMVLSEGIWPSSWILCSRQNNSQALPTWIPRLDRCGWKVLHAFLEIDKARLKGDENIWSSAVASRIPRNCKNWRRRARHV